MARGATQGFTQFGAVGLALAGYTLWVLADASLKLAGVAAAPAYELTGLVGLWMVVLLAARALWRRNVRALWPRHPGRQMGRAVLDVANTVCVVIALRHLTLAMFYILVFSSPMVITLLAAAFLGERLEWRKGLAIVVGFAGVAVAVSPMLAARAPGDWTGVAATMVCVASFSVNMVWSRRMTQTETPESLTFFSGAVIALVGLGGMLWRAAAVSGAEVGVLGAAGLFCVVGSLCFFVALRHAPAAVVSQFHYSQLLTGAVLAWVLWHERVTAAMLWGAVLIVGSGVYTAARTYERSPQIRGKEGIEAG